LHDYVARVRRALGTRKVGHAGTLDPMATGMLVIGVGRATRLLGHLTGSDKEYLATVRLGQTTDTDDAQGAITSNTGAAGVSDSGIFEAVRQFRGTIEQRPSAVSAVKVDGKRAYARVRAGEDVELAPRTVTVTDLEVLDVRRDIAAVDTVDVDIRVHCSAGTYIRAIARDLGAVLGVGGHVTALRRTRSGQFSAMVPLADFEAHPALMPLNAAVTASFETVTLDTETSARARHGVRVPVPAGCPSGTVGVFDAEGAVISLAVARDDVLVPSVVFVDA
jgi:tRNA pseudouridine55 synthase